jgi:hypothetical protein
MTRRRRGAVPKSSFGAVVAVVTLTTGGGAAKAHNAGSSPPAGDPQNAISFGGGSSWATHSVSFYDVQPAMRQATVRALNNIYANTDLSVQYNPDNTSADVRILEDFFGLNNALAWVNCPPDASPVGSHPTLRCFNQTLKYNVTYAYSEPYTTSEGRKFIACHELGHTVGLRHAFADNHPDPDSTCMRTLPLPDPPPQGLNNHDAQIINFFH